MFDKRQIIQLFTEFLNLKAEIRNNDVILINDNYYCIPEEITHSTLKLQNNDNSIYYIISHKLEVERDNIKLECEEKKKFKKFILIYDADNDIWLDNYREKYSDLTITPKELISFWLNDKQDLDNSLNSLSYFIWDLKDFLIENKNLIFGFKYLPNDSKLDNIIEIILKYSNTSLLKEGNLINLFNEENRWKLFLIFKRSNYILEDIFNRLKYNFVEKEDFDNGLLKYINDLILFKVEFKAILKIFIIAKLLESIGTNYITNVNFSSFIDEMDDFNDEEKELFKNLNRKQILTFSQIFQNHLTSLFKFNSLNKLSIIISQIQKIGILILKSIKLKEITIESFSIHSLDIYEYGLELSKLDYFYFLPLKVSEICFKYLIQEMKKPGWKLNFENIGKLRKIADNLKTSIIYKKCKKIDLNYRNMVKFYNLFYNLCELLNYVSHFIYLGFDKWNLEKWITFYSKYGIKIANKLDEISKFRFFHDYCINLSNGIIKWIKKFKAEQEKIVSEKFLEFIKINYPIWIKNYNNPNICPLMTSNVFSRFISNYFKRPVKNNFIILNDGCSIEIWKIIKRNLKKDFKDYKFDVRIGISIIPSKTEFSRKAFFIGKTMDAPSYFSKPESSAFLDLIRRVKKINRNVGYDHDCFFNTHCEWSDIFDKVIKNIKTGTLDLPQIIIFNFTDSLNEAFDQSDVKDIIINTFYSKIKELINTILKNYPKPNIFFITDHGIVDAKEKLGNLIFKNNQGQKFSLGQLIRQKGCKSSSRTIEVENGYYLDFDSIQNNIKNRFLYIDDLSKFGLSSNKFKSMVIASSSYTFYKKKKSHGGISMSEMIIPFIRMFYSPSKMKSDFINPIIKIDNKKKFETSANNLKLSILNENPEKLSKIRVHLITENSHQIKKRNKIDGKTKVQIEFLCKDKGSSPIKIKVDYYYQNIKLSDFKEFSLDRDDYSEVLESSLDDLIDEEF